MSIVWKYCLLIMCRMNSRNVKNDKFNLETCYFLFKEERTLSDPKALESTSKALKAHFTTPLIVACKFKQIKCVELLLSIPGLNVNQTDSRKETALHWACRTNFETAVTMLLSHGSIQPRLNNAQVDILAHSLLSLLFSSLSPSSLFSSISTFSPSFFSHLLLEDKAYDLLHSLHFPSRVPCAQILSTDTNHILPCLV